MDFKDTSFSKKQSLQCRGRLIRFDRPLLMGVLNITPDSFYSGSRILDPEKLREKAVQMTEEGADILDVGAYSSRPGARDIPETEELSRLEKALPVIRKASPEPLLSVDTFRHRVAERAVREFGADIINDVSGGNLDSDMFDTVARLGVPYVLMHMRGTPANMQEHAVYKDVVNEIMLDFSGRINRLNRLGVKDIIIDPGFGFAKTVDHNFQILSRLGAFRIFQQPIMTGLSRKSMIYKTLDTTAEDALNGTTVLHALALMKGTNILRVHDVRPAREAILLVSRMLEAGSQAEVR